LPIADQNHGTLKGRRATLKAVKLYSLELDIAPLTGRIIKNRLPCFRKRRIFATKWYVTLCIFDQSIVRNRPSKLEFTLTKSRLFWKGLHTLRVKQNQI